MTDRYCMHCGKKLRRRPNEPPAMWGARRWCSRECRSAATMVTMHCEACGKRFTVRYQDAPRRRFCSHACAQAPRAKAARTSICECGETVTTTVYFETATADGSILPNYLKVCDACAAVMLATDPTVRTEPYPLDRAARSWGRERTVTEAEPTARWARPGRRSI